MSNRLVSNKQGPFLNSSVGIQGKHIHTNLKTKETPAPKDPRLSLSVAVLQTKVANTLVF